MRQYAPVRDYLGQKVADGVNVKLQYGQNYSATLQALSSGNGEIAETGPFAAALGVMADDVDIALERHAYGSWDYTSVIVTKKDSDVQSLSDLAGKTVAFADVTSASGSLYPLHMLKSAGLSIGEAPTSDKGADFSGTWTSHSQAFSALKDGQADAAGVGKFITMTENDNGDRVMDPAVRVVKKTSGIPRAPIVTSPKLDDNKQSNIVDWFKNAPDSMFYGKDGKEGTDDDLWFDGVRPASLETYQPVINVAKDLDLSTDLLDSA